MFARAIAAVVLLAGVPAAAFAQDTAVVRPEAVKACKLTSATTADAAEVAYNPQDFAGKCVRLQGYWRDVAVYPTRAEANQPDARSMPFLDRRRIGLYLAPKDDARAPTATAAAHLVGVVGNCATLIASGVKTSGYCSYKMGAFLAVSSVTLDK